MRIDPKKKDIAFHYNAIASSPIHWDRIATTNSDRMDTLQNQRKIMLSCVIHAIEYNSNRIICVNIGSHQNK